MNKLKIIATVVHPGNCRYYEKGKSFVLGGFTVAGICESAYAVLSRDSQTLRYGGKLPWEKKGRVQTRCPDPNGALWELRQETIPDSGVVNQRFEDLSRAGHEKESFWEVQTCRGSEGQCPFALTELTSLKKKIENITPESGWRDFLKNQVPGTTLPHQQLRVSLAACPNACTQPQIKDIGIIAYILPQKITHNCSACGKCEKVCKESAVKVKGNIARLDQQICLGCSLCVWGCPEKVIETNELRFRILVGGKLGRHPMLAKELLLKTALSETPIVISKLLSIIMRNIKSGEKVGNFIERIEIRHLTSMITG